MREINFNGNGDPKINTGEDYTKANCTGNLVGCDVSRASFADSNLKDLDADGANMNECDFTNTILENVNFCGVKLNNARNFESVKFKGKTLFDDNTEIDGIDLVKISLHYPLIASKLRQHRYLRKFKEKRPKIYWLWELTCRCGRSWGRLFSITAGIVVLFSILYFVGTILNGVAVMPCLKSISGQSISILTSFQFSALAFVSFNLPDITWSDQWTGIWVAIEAWLGLAFIGILVTVIATNISRNE